jgi:hypothetical protein
MAIKIIDTEMDYEEDVYLCVSCATIWGYFPEDYGDGEYPEKCPLCSMPILDMIKDTYEVGGLREVLFWLVRRCVSGSEGQFNSR